MQLLSWSAPAPVIVTGLVIAADGMHWLSRISVHDCFVTDPPLTLVLAVVFGAVFVGIFSAANADVRRTTRAWQQRCSAPQWAGEKRAGHLADEVVGGASYAQRTWWTPVPGSRKARFAELAGRACLQRNHCPFGKRAFLSGSIRPP